MLANRLNKARELIKAHPTLIWSTRQFDKLNEASIIEAIFNYGNWDEFLKLEKIFGRKKLAQMFKKLTSGRRINLRPKAVNFFKHYFAQYVS